MDYADGDPLWPDIEAVLTEFRNIAVVGLSDRAYRTSNWVTRYMLDAGYRITPVNPQVAEVFGRPSYPDLTAVPEPLEIVNIFRRPEHVGEVVDQAIDRQARAVWMQLGVIDDAAAERARLAGLRVIMDRCIMVEHRRLASLSRHV